MALSTLFSAIGTEKLRKWISKMWRDLEPIFNLIGINKFKYISINGFKVRYRHYHSYQRDLVLQGAFNESEARVMMIKGMKDAAIRFAALEIFITDEKYKEKIIPLILASDE